MHVYVSPEYIYIYIYMHVCIYVYLIYIHVYIIILHTYINGIREGPSFNDSLVV